MDSHAQLARRSTNPSMLGDNAAEREEEDAPAENPLLVMHRLMMGRYIITAILGLIIGGTGAYLARKFVRDKYASVGTLSVQPTLPHVLYENELNGELPMYRAYVDMQTSLISSEKVLDLAAQDPKWIEFAGPPGPDSAGELAGGLKAAHDSDSELITITYSDPVAAKCTVAVRAIINAYLTLYSQNDATTRARRFAELAQNVKKYSDDYQRLNKQAMEVAREFGSRTLDQNVESKRVALEAVNTAIQKVDLDILAAQSLSLPTSRPAVVANPRALALSDPALSRLFDKLDSDTNDLAEMKRQGFGDNHAMVLHLQTEIDNLNRSISARVELIAQNTIPGTNNLTIPGNLDTLKAQREALVKLRDGAKKEYEDVGAKNLKLHAIDEEASESQRMLKETKQRMEELRVESGSSGRIEVESFGDRPQLQSKKRKLVTAAAGGGGFIFAFAAVLALQFFNRRMRHVADIMPETAVRKLRLLGAIPTLPEDDSALLDNSMAAQAVHRVRARLQIEASASDQRVITITSPAPGNGKSCVTTALGISFASSGSRVLLIDADLVGGGLTARFKARVRHNVVDLLRRRTPITEEQLAYASRLAKKNPNRFVKALVEQNFLDCQTVNQVVMECNQSNLGMLDALNGELVSHCIAQTAWPKLFILPRGLGTAADSNRVSPTALRRLLQHARAEFDIILIDTGPIFGSIEASMAACEADGTILVVTRGESRVAVHGAISELNSVRARLIGAIFNRAKDRDVNSYGMMSISRLTSYPTPQMLESAGTVVDAVHHDAPPVHDRDSVKHESLLDLSAELS